jgi:hypothetical protein
MNTPEQTPKKDSIELNENELNEVAGGGTHGAQNLGHGQREDTTTGGNHLRSGGGEVIHKGNGGGEAEGHVSKR